MKLETDNADIMAGFGTANHMLGIALRDANRYSLKELGSCYFTRDDLNHLTKKEGITATTSYEALLELAQRSALKEGGQITQEVMGFVHKIARGLENYDGIEKVTLQPLSSLIGPSNTQLLIRR